jgi:hypothetical protein
VRFQVARFDGLAGGQPLRGGSFQGGQRGLKLAWRVLDHDGQDLIAIDGTAGGDYTYGLGAGYVGSYEHTGTYRGRDVAGRAYIEYIDCR